MAKLHQIAEQISKAAGHTATIGDQAIYVFFTADCSEQIAPTKARLTAAGYRVLKSRHRTFKGARLSVAIRNVGTAFQADWELV